MTHRRQIILGHPAVPQKLLLVPLSILPEAAVVEPIHPKCCQLGTLPLDFPPLNKLVVDWQALKLSTTGCQISGQYQTEGSQSSCSKCFP